MYKCVCGKEFKTMNSLHGHRAKCNEYQKELSNVINKHLTKEFLEWWYISKKKSANSLAKLLNKKYGPTININAGKIIYRCKEFEIPTWSLKESNNLPDVKKYRHEHNNLAKGSPGYNKRQETLAKEGITNVFQREEVKAKIKQTLKEKYGVSNPIHLITNKNNGNISKPHLKTIEFLKSMGYIENIDFISEQRNFLNAFNKELNKDYCPRPDILFPNKKLVIEIYGDLLHANPQYHSELDVIHTWGGNLTAGEIWKRDKIRENHIKSLGYDVIILWESEITKNDFYKLIEYGL